MTVLDMGTVKTRSSALDIQACAEKGLPWRISMMPRAKCLAIR